MGFQPGDVIFYQLGGGGEARYNPMTRAYTFRVGSKELIWIVILTPNAVDGDGDFLYRMEVYPEDKR
jgi:hypothetical protein